MSAFEQSGQKVGTQVNIQPKGNHIVMAELIWKDKTLDEFQKEVGEWGEATFPHSQIESIANHFYEEASEFVQAVYHPEDGGNGEWWSQADEEAADCVLLLMHYFHRRDKSLVEVMEAKMKVNRTRKWGEPGEKGYSKHED